MKKLITLILIAISFNPVIAQSNHKLEQMGDEAMLNGLYSYAVHYYSYILFKIDESDDAIYYAYDITTNYKKPEKVDESGAIKPPENPTNKEIRIIHKLAEAYLKADDYANAEIWFEAANQHPLEEFPYARYFYGLTLMKNYKYDEAVEQFEQFKKENGNSDNKFYKLADAKIINCEFAKNKENLNKDLYITNLDSTVNIGSTSFGLQFFSDEYMIFSAAKPDSGIIYKNAELKEYLLDLYLVKIDEKGNFIASEKFPWSINTPDHHEGSASISPDGNILFYTSADPLNVNNTQIYRTKKLNGNWLQPQPLGPDVNAPGFISKNPYITRDGKKLYFSSNRPGGEGGMDIWVVDINQDGFTSNIQNLGTFVNTPDDEVTPFYHEYSKALYFSSAGHIGFGGLDIFESKINPNTEWFGNAKNIGAPANSSRDDSYYILDEKGQEGYLTSDRDVCEACDTVYNLQKFCNKIYQIKKPEVNFLVKGYVYDEDSGEPIANAKIEFKDVSFKWEHFAIQTDENGYYEQELIPEVELFLKATKPDYFADQAILSNMGETESKVYEQDFYLRKIPKGEMVIEGIEYDFDKATLRPESKVILDNVVKFLELNDNISIEIRSHTDMRGSDSYNLSLSQRRAESVVNYLIEHGIDRSRLIAKGYGETEPAEVPDKNGNLVKLTPEYIKALPTEAEREEAHQRNRRTAFKVLNQ
jgi:outer membrane protein OmpA-like peptidoglycan-associated protein